MTKKKGGVKGMRLEENGKAFFPSGVTLGEAKARGKAPERKA